MKFLRMESVIPMPAPIQIPSTDAQALPKSFASSAFPSVTRVTASFLPPCAHFAWHSV